MVKSRKTVLHLQLMVIILCKQIDSINLETKTFTVLEWVTPELVCMVANGNSFEFLNPQKNRNKGVMYEYKCKMVRVVDGDTVDVDIDLGFGVWLRNQRIRMYGIDTPESRTSDDVEKSIWKTCN